eukprot:scaffold2006_cov141-Isochrysis_galbana.AAC.1
MQHPTTNDQSQRQRTDKMHTKIHTQTPDTGRRSSSLSSRPCPSVAGGADVRAVRGASWRIEDGLLLVGLCHALVGVCVSTCHMP